ncbi:hypothetical protein L4Z68_001278 [Pseudomonas aeruginosa]|nr:hypothetical protein [Pseudomonas aeruginosa]EKX2969285.1 hypothetical protein [Pseudomonas aeruginosa]
MRKRIPLTPEDIQADGRPGPISRIAFLIKDHWTGEKIKLSQAQEIEALGLGYRNLKELQVHALAGAETMPVPGTIGRGEIKQIFAWGVHRKCGIPYAAALDLAANAGLRMLAVDKLTSDAATEALLSNVQARFPVKRVAFDEYHMLRSPFATKWTETLIAAGAPPFEYWIEPDGNAFRFSRMIQAVQGLPVDLAERLAQEEKYAGLEGADQVVSAYLTEEVIPSAAQAIGDAVKDGLLPTGTEIITLFNEAGQYRGRCLYYTRLEAIVPTAHMDMQVFQVAQDILLGKVAHNDAIAAGRTHRGNFGDFPGDEALYTLRSTYGDEYRAMLALIEAGKGDQVEVAPDLLRPLQNVFMRDSRHVHADGLRLSQTAASKIICGDLLFDKGQVLVRAQDLLRPNEVPPVVVSQMGIFPEPSDLDYGDVTERDLAVTRQAELLLRKLENAAEKELSSAGALERTLGLADQICPCEVVGVDIDKQIAAVLPQPPQPTQLEPYSPEAYDDARHAFSALYDRARIALRGLGADTADKFPALARFTHEQLGWIAATSQGVEFGDEETWEFEYLNTDEPRDIAALNSQLLLQACHFASAGSVMPSTSGFSDDVLQITATLVLTGAVPPAAAASTLLEVSRFSWRTAYSAGVIRGIQRWRTEQDQAEASAKELGLRSVGKPVLRLQDITLPLREGRKFGSGRMTITQSRNDLNC